MHAERTPEDLRAFEWCCQMCSYRLDVDDESKRKETPVQNGSLPAMREATVEWWPPVADYLGALLAEIPAAEARLAAMKAEAEKTRAALVAYGLEIAPVPWRANVVEVPMRKSRAAAAPWTAEEDAILIADYMRSSKADIADQLPGRTMSSIYTRVAVLRRHGKL